ncbi:MAG: P-loop NTPase [Dethiobacteria bacterium]
MKNAWLKLSGRKKSKRQVIPEGGGVVTPPLLPGGRKVDMIIAVASGKGGTGKTTVATNLALVLAQEMKIQFLDCDVEEPNAHLFLKPELKGSEPVSIPVPQVAQERCSYCGLCAEVCAFNAIMVGKEAVLVFEQLCHGCGGCAYFCPEKAIREVDRPIGVLEHGAAGAISFVHGKLNPGEALAPPADQGGQGDDRSFKPDHYRCRAGRLLPGGGGDPGQRLLPPGHRADPVRLKRPRHCRGAAEKIAPSRRGSDQPLHGR